MKRTRAQFKLALRYCKQHEDMLRADALANSLSGKDNRKFWNTVHKSNNCKAAKYASTIDGSCGDAAIADKWHDHFESLYNSANDFDSMRHFYNRMTTVLVNDSQESECYLTVHDIIVACSKQKCGKAMGPDNMAMEALIYGTNRLYVHLCLLFNFFLSFGY